MDKAMARDASLEMPEKLGSISVSDTGGTNAGPQIRTSARVHKKLRLDAALASEKKDSESKDDDTVSDAKDGKSNKASETKSNSRSSEQASNTPSTSKPKRSSPAWSAEEKDTFFQALNEHGKDFETIHNVFLAKAHERNVPENLVKSKEQIRVFYYRTWHKLTKYLKFSQDIKRGVQELYALINYGEFRKFVGLLSEKSCAKLYDLILRGRTHFYVRGKFVKLKTPQCPALQKLNRLDVPEWKEELQLPSHIIVELRPRSIDDWCRVQSVSQNPRVRTLLPLEQRLSSLLAFLQQRWRPPLLQHRDELLSSVLLAKLKLDLREGHAKEPAPVLHMAPSPGARISFPSLCLSEYLTSSSLSLSAYQERFSNKETLPPFPRRMQLILNRPRSKVRSDSAKISLLAAETSHKKPCVLGKDVEALVAAAAAAAAAIEAKAKASAALAEQTEGAGTPAQTTGSDSNVSGTTLLDSASSGSSVPVSENSSPTNVPSSVSTSVTSADTATKASKSVSTSGGNTSGAQGVKSGGGSHSECSSVGKALTDSSSEVMTSSKSDTKAEKNSRTEIHLDGVLESEAEVKVPAGTEAAAPADSEARAPQEVPAQTAGGAASETKVKTEGDAKADTKVDMKVRAQMRKEKAAAKLEEIRQGWSLENARAVSVGELYLMFGHEGKIELEYWWEERASLDQKTLVGKGGRISTIASVLQKLVSITKLNYKKPKLICPCGHVCGTPSPSKTPAKSKAGGKNAKETQEKSPAGGNPGTSTTGTGSTEKITPISVIPAPIVPPPAPVSIPIPVPVPVPTVAPPGTIPHRMLFPTVQDGVFRRPLIAPMYRTNHQKANVEAIKAQLEKFRPKYCNRRGRSVRQKGVVVQRMLPLLPKVPDSRTMLALKVIPQTATKVAGEFVPIRPQPDGFSFTSQSGPSTMHIHPNDAGVIRRQQTYIQPNLITPTPVSVAGNLPTLDHRENLNLQQVQQQDQIITVSIAPSNCGTNLQQPLCSSLGSIRSSTVETFPVEENTPSSSSPPMPSPPPSISHLLDLDGGSTAGDDISLSGVSCGLLDAALTSSNVPSTSQTFTGLLSDEVSQPCPGSPPLIKLPDQQWLNSEVGDFSLSSLLNHLESPVKGSSTQIMTLSCEDASDVEAQLQCLMSENSVDYSAKFAVLAAQIAASAENKK